MTALAYITGAASLVALVLALALAAVRIRSRLLPPLTVATARLSEIVIALAILIVVSEALGTVGLFRRVPLLLGCWAVTAIVLWATRDRTSAIGREAPAAGWIAGAAAAAGAGIVLFAFGAGTLSALHGANWDIDSIGYHLPEALRFYQSHRLTGLQFTSVDPAPAYYPANSELLHAVGMVLFRRDLLSVWINLGFAALGLLAGWCLGEALGSPPATLLAFAALAVAPQVAQGGTALNDGVGMTMIVAAAALGLSPSGSRVAAVGALAAGLALGTKLNLLVPSVCLVLAAVALAGSERRARTAWTWIAGIALGGGYWFARDLAHTGSPLPLLNLGPLPHVTLLPGEGTNLVQALRAGTLPLHEITSSLSSGLGRAWPAVLAAAAVGLVLAVWRGSATQRALGLVATVSLISFAFTPLTGSQFLWTVRYAAPALVLCLALTANVPSAGSWRGRWAPLGLLALTAVTLAPAGGPHRSAVLLAVLGGLATAVCLGVLPGRGRRGSAAPRVAVAIGAAVALIAGLPVSRTYLRERFTAEPGSGPAATGLLELADFARSTGGARIGIVGMELQYQLAGPTLSSYVQYLGRSAGDGNWGDIHSCSQWRHAVNAGHYRYIVTAPPFWPTLGASLGAGVSVAAAGWTAGDPAARVLLRPYPTVTVFRLDGPFRDPSCATVS